MYSIVWANSGRQWRTGKPGTLQSLGSQRSWHNLVTKQQQCIVSYHLECQFYFFFCSLDFLSFSSLIAMARTSKTMLNKTASVRILILFLILEEMLSAFYHWVWYSLYVCHIWPLLCWNTFLLCPISGKFLSQMSVGFCQKLFLYLLIWPYGFYISICWWGSSP